jgi:hypothetical protein
LEINIGSIFFFWDFEESGAAYSYSFSFIKLSSTLFGLSEKQKTYQ